MVKRRVMPSVSLINFGRLEEGDFQSRVCKSHDKYIKIGNFCHFSVELQLFRGSSLLQAAFRSAILENWKLGQVLKKPLANKVSSMFGGTRDKCFGCTKTVYTPELLYARVLMAQ